MNGEKKSGAQGAKSQKTLLHFFQRQSQTSAPILKINCPACDLEVPQSKINWHLDQNCKSRSDCKKTRPRDRNLAKRKKILKSVKNEIAIRKRQKVVLSDNESDVAYESDSNHSKEIEILENDDHSDSENSYITSSMVETRIFEIDGEVVCTTPIKSPGSSPSRNTEDTSSPYFSSNRKDTTTVSPLKQSEKVIDFQIPSSSRNSSIAMLEADWSSPHSTPTKNEGERDAEILPACSKVISPQIDSSSEEVKETIEKDRSRCSPLTTPRKMSLSKSSPSCGNITKPNSESEDFEENTIEFRTPKKISKSYSNSSPKSSKKLKEHVEKANASLLTSPKSNCSRSCEDSDEDFEENPIQCRTPVKLSRKYLKKSPGSSKKLLDKNEASQSNISNILSSPVSGSSRSCGDSEDSESYLTPLQSPCLVSPTRSPSPLVDNVNTTIDDHPSLDSVNKTGEDTYVRKLFTPPNSPTKASQKSIKSSPTSSKVNLSESIRNNTNRFSKVDRAHVGEGNLSDVLCDSSSQSQEREASQSSQKNPRIWVRTPRKINQSIKSSALLQNSPQKLSGGFFGRKRSQSISPEKPNSGSPKLLKDSAENTLNEKYDKAMFRGHKGYYLENFLLILKTVMSEPQDVKLFDDNDLSIVHDFHGLSLQAQKLYVRLFQRKIKWNKISKIEYRDICDQDDTELYVNELAYANFLLMESELCDLHEVLQLLSAEELQGLCKQMKIPATGKKEDMINTLRKFTKQQRTIISAFSKGASNNSLILKRAKELMGRCCIINKEVRRVFMRILMLYGLPRYDEEDDKGNHSQLITLLLVNMGKMNFPSYDLIRHHDIFQTRDDLIRFECCSQILSDVQECIESQKWEEALSYCDVAKSTYQELIDEQQLMDHDKSLPQFLRRFTSISVLVHILTYSVECYQRLKNYRKAVEQLEYLLKQRTHLQDYRGRWYDRLALNLEMHLKSPKAVEVIREALSDPEVRKGHRLALSIRAQRMAASSRFKSLAPSILEMPLMNPREAPQVIIEGRCLTGDSGYKKVFIRQDSARHAGEGEVTVCSVEELALGYYKSQGYTEGLHREGTTVNSLFGLLFWDALYSPVPDVFRSPHQATPLDLDDPHFYAARKELIDKRLMELHTWSEEEAEAALEKVWNEHMGKVTMVAWDIFRSLEYVKGLVASMSLPVLASICRRLAEDHRFSRSGFPDLIVWNPVDKKCRIVEVKGPNDRLSTKQILWLDYLLEHGAVAEVCHVQAIGAKKMKLASPRRISPKKRSPVKKVPSQDDKSTAVISGLETEGQKGRTRQKRKQAKNSEEHNDDKKKKRPNRKKTEVEEGEEQAKYAEEQNNDKRKKRPNRKQTEVHEGKNQSSKKKDNDDDDFEGPPPRKRRQSK